MKKNNSKTLLKNSSLPFNGDGTSILKIYIDSMSMSRIQNFMNDNNYINIHDGQPCLNNGKSLINRKMLKDSHIFKAIFSSHQLSKTTTINRWKSIIIKKS